MRRLFVGISLPEDDRHGLAALLDPLAPWPGRAVPPANWHITLRFVGSADEVATDRLFAQLDEMERPGPFTVRLEGLGAFPRPRSAAVLWMGVEDPSGSLVAAADATELAVQAAGFPAEERPFHPHLTLARIRPPQDVWSWLEKEPVYPLAIAVSELTLFETRFGAGGAHYESVERFPL